MLGSLTPSSPTEYPATLEARPESGGFPEENDSWGGDGGGPSGTLVPRSGEPLSITTEILPSAGLNEAYNQAVTATGGTYPYVWRIRRGSLPSGLVLDAYSGVISGIATAMGSYRFRLRVKDSTEPRRLRARRAYTIEVVLANPQRYSCDYQGGCVSDPQGVYDNSSCNNACSPNTSSPDLAAAYRILTEVAASHSIEACPTWSFLDVAIKRLRETSTRWGYHRYPRTKSSLTISQDRIAWYSGPGAPVDGSNQVLAYDIISNYCSDNPRSPATLRRPTLVDSREFDYKDQWAYPREEQAPTPAR